MKKTYKYYYIPCDAGNSVNGPYRHYFRLYADSGDGKPRLVDQGLADKIPAWEAKYPNLELSIHNPYPMLD